MQKTTAIKFFGRPTDLAEALNITSGSISQWGELIPEKQALRLARITNGELEYDPALYENPPRLITNPQVSV